MGEVTARVDNMVRGLIITNNIGYRLPPERMMADTFGCARTTIRIILMRFGPGRRAGGPARHRLLRPTPPADTADRAVRVGVEPTNLAV